MVCIFLNVEDGQKNIHCMFLSVKKKDYNSRATQNEILRE